MARQQEDGLRYFSFDTDFFFSDRRIRALRTRFGNDGIAFLIWIWAETYRDNGYFLRWDEDIEDNAIVDLGLKEGFIEQVLTFLVGRSLLHRSILTNSDTIYTSPAIQKRFQAATKGRKRDYVVDGEIWLLSEEDTASHIKVTNKINNSEKNNDNSEKNDDNSKKNDIKEKKRNKKKEKESSNETAKPFGTSGAIKLLQEKCFSHDLEEVLSDWIMYKTEKRQQYKETGFKNLLKQVENNVNLYGYNAVIDVIRLSMSNNWQGIIWDRIDKSRKGDSNAVQKTYGGDTEENKLDAVSYLQQKRMQ